MLNQSADYRLNVYAPIRQFDAKMTFTFKGVSTTYYDDKIISFNLVEEMNTINNTLPANELSIVMNNTSGDFNMLQLAKMYEIIASKPQIDLSLGLVTAEKDAETFSTSYTNKIAGSLVENPNVAKYGSATTIVPPSTFASEFNTTQYGQVINQEGTSFVTSTTTNLNYREILFSINVIRVLEDRYTTGIWGGKTAMVDKIALAVSYLNTITFNLWGYGSSPTGNKISLVQAYGYNADGTGSSSYSSPPVSHTSNTIQKISITPSLLTGKIDVNGNMHFVAYSEVSNGTVSSAINIDKVELMITTNPIKAIEWIPMGKYTLINWKNQVSNMSIQMTARDQFDILSEISYENLVSNTLYNLAVDIFTKAGITSYSIDNSLKNISGAFKERISMREALQHIGIASRSAVLQDRTGMMVIKPFQILDETSNYLRYAGQSQNIAGTYWAQPLISTGAGMRYIDFDNQYTEPDVSLDKSIYEIIIKNYADPNNPTDIRYINTVLGGNNGASFTIDNPLINTVAVADKVAEWYIRETNYNAIYKANWRGNPILECADIVLVEDSFGTDKQTRITKNEFSYEGFLTSNLESRGGI